MRKRKNIVSAGESEREQGSERVCVGKCETKDFFEIGEIFSGVYSLSKKQKKNPLFY